MYNNREAHQGDAGEAGRLDAVFAKGRSYDQTILISCTA
jgi:hypothetical protein